MRWLLFAGAACLAVAAVWWLSEWSPAPQPHAPSPAPTPRQFTGANSRAAEKQNSGAVAPPELLALAAQLNASDTTASDDVQILDTLLANYRRANDGENPVGGVNEEVMDALRGKNARHFAVFPSEHPSVNARGELLDRWGHAYFFHALAHDEMEIRSAGPDGQLWTADDVLK